MLANKNFTEVNIIGGRSGIMTPLYTTKAHKRMDIIDYLLHGGADPRICPPGVHALTIAEMGNSAAKFVQSREESEGKQPDFKMIVH